MTQHGARPTWLGYPHVADVEAACKAIEADGGKTLMPKRTLPVGDIAMVADPMGSPFYVMRPVPPPDKPEAVSDVFGTSGVERVRWNELATGDLERAKTFYRKHFAFEVNDVGPMGPMGDDCFLDHRGVRIGAMMQKPSDMPMGVWTFYFGVPSIMEGKRAVEANGGTILLAPHAVPTGEWILVACDPADATFGLVSTKGD